MLAANYHASKNQNTQHNHQPWHSLCVHILQTSILKAIHQEASHILRKLTIVFWQNLQKLDQHINLAQHKRLWHQHHIHAHMNINCKGNNSSKP